MKDEIRPKGGITTNVKCRCGCNNYIIHSWNRIRRSQKAPDYIWGHFGILSLKKYRFKKGNKSWNEGKRYKCKQISESRKGRNLPGMFQKGHKLTQGKKHPRYGKFGKYSPVYGKKYKKRKKETKA